jgi:hypothetical protein
VWGVGCGEGGGGLLHEGAPLAGNLLLERAVPQLPRPGAACASVSPALPAVQRAPGSSSGQAACRWRMPLCRQAGGAGGAGGGVMCRASSAQRLPSAGIARQLPTVVVRAGRAPLPAPVPVPVPVQVRVLRDRRQVVAALRCESAAPAQPLSAATPAAAALHQDPPPLLPAGGCRIPAAGAPCGPSLAAASYARGAFGPAGRSAGAPLHRRRREARGASGPSTCG